MGNLLSDPEADLVRRARSGDTEAFNALVAANQKIMLSVAMGILQDSGRADEAVQDAFVSAWKSLSAYRGEASFRNWLCRIAVNKSYSILRWGRLRRWLSLDQTAERDWSETLVDSSADADPERQTLQDERSGLIRAAVAGLPLQERTAVTLRANGLDVLDIARAMNVAEGTVKAHLHHARAHLSKILGAP
jgi:RNA polymerase sigma-70 factor (ECF subfamily)